jgi:hypothetical protein
MRLALLPLVCMNKEQCIDEGTRELLINNLKLGFIGSLASFAT